MIFKRESTFEQILKKNETYLISESLDFPKIISFYMIERKTHPSECGWDVSKKINLE